MGIFISTIVYKKNVGRSGLEPLTFALSTRRSEPTELTSFLDHKYRLI
jgi:hypothetical protein